MPRKLVIALQAVVLTSGLAGSITADAARGRRASIDQTPFQLAWESESPCVLTASGNVRVPCALRPTADGATFGDRSAAGVFTPIALPGGMRLHIGDKTYTHVWINRNGFISLAENAASEAAEFQSNATDLSTVTGDIIAPFYAPVAIRIPDKPVDVQFPAVPGAGECDSNGAPNGCLWDLTYSTLDKEIPPADPDNPPDPVPHQRGMRVSWGMFPRPDNDNPGGVRGVTMTGGSTNSRNVFQVWLLDQSEAPGNDEGDFDIQLNYSGVFWEGAPTLVGVRAGGAGSTPVLVDFKHFYPTSFLDDSVDIAPANKNDCAGGSNTTQEGNFDKRYALGCNWITIQFRGGRARLETFTSDLTVAVAADAVAGGGARHTTVPYGVTVTVGNAAGSNPATNVDARIALPAGASISPATSPGCTQNGSVARCVVASLAANASTPISLMVTSTQTDNQHFDVVSLTSDQYEYRTQDNVANTANIAVSGSANLSITGCARPASMVQNSPITVTCTVRNDGPQAATNVVLATTVPAGLTFSSGTGCSVTGTALSCTLASLAAGAPPHDFPIVFNTPGTGAMALSMTAQSDTFDPQASAATDASFTVTALTVPPVGGGGSSSGGGGGGGGGGRLSFESLAALLLAICAVARRRYARGVRTGG